LERPAAVEPGHLERMPAITVHQPYATAIARHGKRTENRGWPAPLSMVGQRLAIHASQRWVAGEDIYPEATLPQYDPVVYPAGVVLAVARLAWCCAAGIAGDPWCECDVWARDDLYHWGLADVVALPEPVPCRGHQRIWYLPLDVAAEVAAQLDQISQREGRG
jgi:hypothetical protein